MYTTENYIWGCIGYVLGVLLFMPLIWWSTRRLPWYPLRALLRMFSLAVLLTPVFPYEGTSYLAPAWATAVFELIKPTMEYGVQRVLIPIGFCFVVLYALDLCFWQLRLSRAGARQEVSANDAITANDTGNTV